ncbi:MAG: hypothetical protein ABFS14_05680 [Gemmatimonadota bacterium]
MSQRPSSLQSFFAEMKRRRVFRVMAVYGAVAFLVLQAADIAFPRVGLPEWTVTLVLMLSLVGFPIAIVMAWAFESTPEGVKRTAPAAPEEIQAIVAEPRSKRWPAGLLALIAMILLFGTGWWMGGGGSGAGGERAANLLVGEAQASGFKALAVLPFENVNGDDDNRLIAVGVHEDLLTALSRIAALRVTSRTSVREYENTDKSIKEIAEDLGAEYIMEGSVRSSGGQVRVTVRLVDAGTDDQLWSKDYDRDVTPESLFKIQSEIAHEVADQLEAQLTPDEAATLAAMEPAASSAAMQWYYRGLDSYIGSLESIRLARGNLARAVELDPDFAAAWSKLAQYQSRLVFVGEGGEAEARTAMERTAELAPGSVEAQLARGFYEYYARRDFGAALVAFRSAEELAPSDSEVVWAVGLIHRRQGNLDESTAAMKRAAALDPRNPLRMQTLAENLAEMGAFQDGDLIIEQMLAIAPADSRARGYKVINLAQMDGSAERANRLAGELALDERSLEEGNALVWLALLNRDYARVLQILDVIDTGDFEFAQLARLYKKSRALFYLGDPSAALVADSMLDDDLQKTRQPVFAALDRAHGHALAGRRAESVRDLEAASRLVLDPEDHFRDVRATDGIVGAYGILGELDAGLEFLAQMIDVPSREISSAELRLSPAYDPYRGDPRFDDLIARREAFEAEGARKAEAGRPWLP